MADRGALSGGCDAGWCMSASCVRCFTRQRLKAVALRPDVAREMMETQSVFQSNMVSVVMCCSCLFSCPSSQQKLLTQYASADA